MIATIYWYQQKEITWNGLFRFSSIAQANRICALYGRIPWKTQANKSSKDAVRFGSTSYSSLNSFATLPVTRMDTVLLAVAISATETMAAIPASAVCLFLMTFRTSLRFL